MEWIKLDGENIPTKEVLAIGYQKEMLVGHINESEQEGFVCYDENTELTDVTHFILKEELLNLLKDDKKT